MSHEITLTNENFDKTLADSQLPILVDFWAPWCGPCRFIAPVLSQIAEEKSATLKVGKLNVDEHGAIAQRFGITGIPTLILFKGGKPVKQIVGAMPKEALEKEIAQFI